MPCLSLMILLQDNVLTSTQRLKALFIITDLYSPITLSPDAKSTSTDGGKSGEFDNPFLAFFLDSLKYTSDPTEQHFLPARLTDPTAVRS